MKTSAEVVNALKGFLDKQIIALNGMMEKLPESLRGQLQKLKDSLNEQLTKLPPIDQVPAAQDAAWALQSYGDAMIRIQDYAQGLMERLSGMTKELSDRVTALNGWQEKVDKKDLLTKDEAKTLADTARDEGVKSVLPKIISMRKSTVELAGLPMPSDAILGSDDFEARMTNTKAQVEALGKKGLKLGGKGAKIVQETAWLGATEFAGRLEVFADVIGAPANPGNENKKVVDPLLGGGGAGEGNKPTKPRLGLA